MNLTVLYADRARSLSLLCTSELNTVPVNMLVACFDFLVTLVA